MEVRAVRGKTKPRFQTSEVSSLGIIAYGKDNLYPEILRNALLASSTGTECMERYAEFIEGEGFAQNGLGDTIVNLKGETLDDIHSAICEDIAMYNGFALHISYNAFFQVSGVRYVPFINCRLCKGDDWGYISQIAVHPDWSGQLQRNGKRVAVNKDNIEYVNVFNPRREIVQRQIELAGGLEMFGGQILWVNLSQGSMYPISKCDRIFTELLTDAGLSNVKYRNTCCNFLPAAMIVTKRGSGTYNLTEEEQERLAREREDFAGQWEKLQGDMNTGKFIEVNIENDEEKPEIVKLDTNNYDKAFATTEESVTQRIYSAFGQEAWHAIRIGKMGFSGDVITDAYDYYNSVVSKQRRAIERAFKKIFSYWKDGGIDDFSVTPMKFLSSVQTPTITNAIIEE